MTARGLFVSLVLVLIGAPGSWAWAKAPPQYPELSHVPRSCVAPGDYPVVRVSLLSGTELRSAKVYFRAEGFYEFYYVEMKPVPQEANHMFAVLPKPLATTTAVIYYVEGVGILFNSDRTEHYELHVDGACPEKSEVVLLPNGEPSIVVGATAGGSPALPGGFRTVGIIGTITAAGVSSSLGGGASVAVVGVGAAAAAGATVAALTTIAGNDGSEPSEDLAPSGSVPGGVAQHRARARGRAREQILALRRRLRRSPPACRPHPIRPSSTRENRLASMRLALPAVRRSSATPGPSTANPSRPAAVFRRAFPNRGRSPFG